MDEIKPKFYLEGRETWDAMLRLISSASKTIDLEQYIFSDDSIGQRFIDALTERARAGIKVRLLCDTVGSWSFFTSLLPAHTKDHGVEIRFVNPVGPWRIGNFFSWFFRDHRKILIIDKKVGLTGGTGIRDDMHDWRDTNVQVDGVIVDEMSSRFDEMWAMAGDRYIVSRIQRGQKYTKGFQFITNSPHVGKRFLYHTVMDALRNAKKYIYLTSPYFIPDSRLIRILKLAAKKGVDVRVLVPSKGVEPFVDNACHSHYQTLLDAKIKIFEYQKTFLHAKSIVVDDEWSTVGSFNLDSLSFVYNYEANIVSTDPDFIGALKSHFLNDLNESKGVIAEEWAKRPFIYRLREFLVLPIRRLL